MMKKFPLATFRLLAAASIFAILLIILAVAPPTRVPAQTGWAGLLDDNQKYTPLNYTNFVAPVWQGNYNDPVFGTNITRLGNGATQFSGPNTPDAARHEYSVPSPFNADNSRILLARNYGGYFIADLQGKVIVPTTALLLSNEAEPRWSRTNPNVFFFHESNKLRKYDLSTGQKTDIRTFSQYRTIGFGAGETDISVDGDHIIIVGNDRTVGLYTFSTNTLGGTADLQKKRGFNHCDVTGPSNRVICRWNTNGTGRDRGYELFDGNMKFIRQVTPYGAHSDRGVDANGKEWLIQACYSDPARPAGCENNGVEKISIDNPAEKKCLVGLYWNSEVHISANNNSSLSNPWVLVSVTDTGLGTANPPATLSPSWANNWGVRFNEVVMARIDDPPAGQSREVRRLAHHRSRVTDGYWFTPRAAISNDGKYAVFDSNLGARPVADYTDAFLLKLFQ